MHQHIQGLWQSLGASERLAHRQEALPLAEREQEAQNTQHEKVLEG